MCFEKIFFQSVACLFILLSVFHRLVFNFSEVQLSFFFSWIVLLVLYLKIRCQIHYTFRSRIHFEPIYWKGLKSVFRFMSSCSSTICWKVYLFSLNGFCCLVKGQMPLFVGVPLLWFYLCFKLPLGRVLTSSVEAHFWGAEHPVPFPHVHGHLEWHEF